jgi:hypothetical protein
VSREDGRVANVLEGFLRPEAVALNQVGRPRDEEEGAVPFVHVENIRVDVELGKQLITAEAQDHLLPQTVGGVAAVQAIGDRAIFRAIFWHVGIEQEQWNPADFELPGSHLDWAGWERHRDSKRRISPHHDGLERRALEVVGIAEIFLAALTIDDLMEVALVVSEPDRAQGQVQITCRL